MEAGIWSGFNNNTIANHHIKELPKKSPGDNYVAETKGSAFIKQALMTTF